MGAIGIRFSMNVSKRGYYPNGGGRASVHVDPSERVEPLRLGRRVAERAAFLVSRCGRLPVSVAERQAKAAASVLGAKGVDLVAKDVRLEDSISPGSSLVVSLVGEGCYLGGDSIGARGKPAETVGIEAARSFLESFATGASVDVHLADMIAPLLCLSDASSELLVPLVTEHLRTSLHVAGQFTSASHAFESRGACSLLSISPPETK